MTLTPKDRFYALRKKVMQAIERKLEQDDYCKSYEGTFEWAVCYPNYFDDKEGIQPPVEYMLTLHCYVLGPARHYKWYGETYEEVLDKAEKEINQWLN